MDDDSLFSEYEVEDFTDEQWDQINKILDDTRERVEDNPTVFKERTEEVSLFDSDDEHNDVFFDEHQFFKQIEEKTGVCVFSNTSRLQDAPNEYV